MTPAMHALSMPLILVRSFLTGVFDIEHQGTTISPVSLISMVKVLSVSTTPVGLALPVVLILAVRYHCGGWPEEVNTCFLNSYMVYL